MIIEKGSQALTDFRLEKYRKSAVLRASSTFVPGPSSQGGYPIQLYLMMYTRHLVETGFYHCQRKFNAQLKKLVMRHQQVKIYQGHWNQVDELESRPIDPGRNELRGVSSSEKKWKKWKYQVTPKSFPIKNILEAGFSFLVLLPRMKKFFWTGLHSLKNLSPSMTGWCWKYKREKERERVCVRARVCVRRCKRERDNFCLKFEPMSKLISNLAKKWNIARIFFPSKMPQKLIKNLKKVAQRYPSSLSTWWQTFASREGQKHGSLPILEDTSLNWPNWLSTNRIDQTVCW